MKNYILTIAILFLNTSFSQTRKPKFDFFEATALQTGYAYLGKNYGYLGFASRIDNRKTYSYINVGFGSYLGYYDNKIQIVPEAQFNYTLLLLMVDLSVTNKGFTPSLGSNLLNKIKIKSGYQFGFKPDDFKGITFCTSYNFGDEKFNFMQ